MFLPIGDENPRERVPYVNYALLALNILAFVVWTAQMNDKQYFVWLYDHALLPAHPDLGRMLFAMFLHGDIMHLVGNMLFLWIFGDNVEDRLGHVPYLVCYLLFGFAAWGLHIATSSGGPAMDILLPCGHAFDQRHIPALGASGAISGVIGAYLLYFPNMRIRTLLLFYIVTILYFPAWAWIGFWFVEQIYFASRDVGGVAWYAHIGGFVAGVVVAGISRAFESARRSPVTAWKGVPEELAHASRRASIRLEPHDQVPHVTPVGISFVDEPTARFAVLRQTDDMHAIHKTAGAVAQVTGEPPALILARLQSTRGVLARNLSKVDADRLKQTLYRLGMRTLEIPDGPSTRPPAAVLPADVRWNHEQFDYDGHPTLWRTPYLYVAAQVEGAPVLDVFMPSNLRVRLTGATELFEVDRATADSVPRGLDAFAGAVVRYRHGAILNDGVRVLSGHGVWGWLKYANTRDYEDYVFWLYNLLHSRRAMLPR